MPSRARIWTWDLDALGGSGAYDRIDLTVLTPNIIDNEPVIREQDRLGRSVLIVPPEASEAASWAAQLELAFHRRLCHNLNTKPTGGTDRTISEFLTHYYRDLKQVFYVYLETYGKDDAGGSVHTITYYKGHFHGPLPSWLIDGQFATGRGGEYVKLTLIVDQDQGEGTVPDFDEPPNQSPPLVPRTVS